MKLEKEALKSMDLNTLRSLDEDDEIKEPGDSENSNSPEETPLPGQESGGALPTPPEMPSSTPAA